MKHTPPPTPRNTTALVLAGGRGQRMGGCDKGLIPFIYQAHAVPMVQRVLLALENKVHALMISANRHQARYAEFGFPVVSDSLNDRFQDVFPDKFPHIFPHIFQGPAYAVVQASRFIPDDWLLIAPCDMPFYQPHWPQQLFARQWETGADAIIAHDGRALQPTVALIRRSSLAEHPAPVALRALLMAGSFALCDLSADAEDFFNCNTPEQLNQASARYGDCRQLGVSA